MGADATCVPAREKRWLRFDRMPDFRDMASARWRTLFRGGDHTLVSVEPLLRRAAPASLIFFLLVLGGTSGILLYEQRILIEEDGVQDMQLAVSLARAESNATAAEDTDVFAVANAVLSATLPAEMLQHGRFGFVADGEGTILAATPGQDVLIGLEVGTVLPGIQPLIMFGERAGILESDMSGEPVLVSTARLGHDIGSIVLVQPKSALFADWRRLVSICVTLYAMISLTLLVILYAYFRQTIRTRAVDAELSETHRRVETALSRGRCGLWDWDLARGHMFWSRSMHEILGMESETGVLSFGEVCDLVHPDDGSLIDVARVIASGKIRHLDRTFRMRRSDGQYIWVRARAEVTRNAANEIHLIGVAVDVTEQHALARGSDEAKTRLKNAIENISESFVLWDASHRLVSCNQMYQDVYGLSDQDVMPGTPHDTVFARKTRKPIATKRISAGNSGAEETISESLLADGRWLQISERRTSDGGFVSIGTDVSQLKAHQERLSTSERRLIATINALSVARSDAEAKAHELEALNENYITEKERAEGASRAKTTFLANMSHELRTPLNAIIGFSEIMRDGSFGPIGCAKYVEYASDIHASGHYLLKLINDILDMSKIEAGRLMLSKETIELNEIIGEARKIVEVQAERKSIDITALVSKDIALTADRRATKQIILNLLANAVKFTDAGGRVELRARTAGNNVFLTIADTGIGISRKALAQLGKPFEQVENELTRTRKGTGLGLAIAQSLVELHDGTIRIFSEPGKGTIVALRMPLHDDRRGEEQRGARAA